jgi:hypothetical protein
VGKAAVLGEALGHQYLPGQDGHLQLELVDRNEFLSDRDGFRADARRSDAKKKSAVHRYR